MAEEKEEKEGEIVAEEALLRLNAESVTAPSQRQGVESVAAPAQPALTDEQIIACAVIGADTGNATAEELMALRGNRPELAAALEARGGKSVLAHA